MHRATFILSSGRCGTQWLAKQLQAVYGDLLSVTHEPLQIGYRPRRLFGHRDPARLETAAEIFAHLDRIERQLKARDYVECGWQCYAMIPSFAARFPGRVQVVHLPRHPVPSAASMVAQRYYSDPPRKDRLTELLLLSPGDDGVRFPEYRERWAHLDEYEKCLYFWAEVHAYALDLDRQLDVPWLRLTSEDLFTRVGLDRLLAFLQVPRREAIHDARVEKVDDHSYKTVLVWDFEAIRNHPRIVAVAEALGYDPTPGDEAALRARYWLEGTKLELIDLPGPVLIRRDEE